MVEVFIGCLSCVVLLPELQFLVPRLRFLLDDHLRRRTVGSILPRRDAVDGRVIRSRSCTISLDVHFDWNRIVFTRQRSNGAKDTEAHRRVCIRPIRLVVCFCILLFQALWLVDYQSAPLSVRRPCASHDCNHCDRRRDDQVSHG